MKRVKGIFDLRIALFLSLILSSLTISAQISNISICGIPMGTPRDEAKEILQERFGRYSVHEDGGDLKIYGGSVGGFSYRFLNFYFTWVNGKPRFNGAGFSTPFELTEQREAIENRDLIKSTYEKKYDIVERKNDDGFKYYIFGSDEQYCGLIEIRKGKSNDGKVRLHLNVYYFGPYGEEDDI